jgi:hypothetical protein
MIFYDNQGDPFNSDLPASLHIQSTYYGGNHPTLLIPVSPNYPEILGGTPSRYFLKTNFIIDVSALATTKPCLIYDSTSALLLTRVTGTPGTNTYRIVTDVTSHRRNIIEFSSTQAGHEIDYDLYAIGGVLNAGDWETFEEEDTAITLAKNKYLITENNIELTLPSIEMKKGDSLQITTKDYFTKIIQSQTENIITYGNSYKTTKGVMGCLNVPPNCSMRLVYYGIGNYIGTPVKLTDISYAVNSSGGMYHPISFTRNKIYMAVNNNSATTVYRLIVGIYTKIFETTETNLTYACSFTPDGQYLAIPKTISPYITIYKNNFDDTFTQLTGLTALAGVSHDVNFSNDGKYLAVSHDGGNHVSAYKNNFDDTFTLLTLPTLAGDGQMVSFSGDGNYLAITYENSPYCDVMIRNNDAFTLLTNFSTDICNGVVFSYDGKYLAVFYPSPTRLKIYIRNGNSFTALNFPASYDGYVLVDSVKFSYDGKYFLVLWHNVNTSVFSITTYRIQNDCFNLESTITLAEYCYYLDSSHDGQYIAYTSSTAPGIFIYDTFSTADKLWQITDINLTNKNNLDQLFV